MVRMDTDEGIAGAVEIESWARYARSVAELTERRLKSLIGENPLKTEPSGAPTAQRRGCVPSC